MQAHQQRQATETVVDRRALRGGIDRDLLAVLPVVLPPGTGAGRASAGPGRSAMSAISDTCGVTPGSASEARLRTLKCRRESCLSVFVPSSSGKAQSRLPDSQSAALRAGADADAGQAEVVVLLGQRILQAQLRALGEHVEAPVVDIAAGALPRRRGTAYAIPGRAGSRRRRCSPPPGSHARWWHRRQRTVRWRSAARRRAGRPPWSPPASRRRRSGCG